METRSTRRMGRRALLAAGFGGAALAAAEALGAPARTLAANGSPVLIGRQNTGSHATAVSVPADPAMKCASDGHDGLWGQSKASGRSGLYGFNSHAKGYGVTGRNTSTGATGVLGGPDAALKGVAPLDKVALHVEGKAHFSRSGQLTVRAGDRGAMADVPVSQSSMVIATIQDWVDGFWVVGAYASYSGQHVQVVLNNLAPRDIPVAWILLD